MNTSPLMSIDRQTAPGWQFAIILGFLALICMGAVLDRRGAILDRTALPSNRSSHALLPLTDAELVEEMLTHD